MTTPQLVIPLSLVDANLAFYPHFLTAADSDHLFNELLTTITWRQEWVKIYGRSHPQPRLTAWYGDAGKTYTYSGITLEPTAWNSTLQDLKSRVEIASGVVFNSVLLNLYRDGNDSMGWHSDDEPELGQDPVIASLSLGGCRRMLMRHRVRKELRHQLDLTPGSLLLMQGRTQHYWQHQIPKTRRSVPPRINLTFRVVQ